MEQLEQLLKELQKTLDKGNVHSVGIALQQKLAEEKKKTRKNQQQAVKEAQNAFSNSRGKLENALKGQFAKKVKEVMEKQEKELEQLAR